MKVLIYGAGTIELTYAWHLFNLLFKNIYKKELLLKEKFFL
ncbi:hypothetical protein [Streptococcus massiliensis]|uniref:Uncharacterized protein n=1 Tax=Streptococcus massiliensis TaxID=313439 RepID=A0A380KW54_9STRE|nr:hypothetical protein [Streptococcus massiliensis]SUN75978.1 Uncharacterised protein [Streptococcus massiliensis]